MVSDQEIASCVESLLHQPTTPTPSASDLLHHVEAKFGLDLSHKAAFIQDQIDLLRGPPPPQDPRPPPPTPLPASPHLLLHPFYQIPPGAYPFTFRFPSPMPPGVATPGSDALHHPYPYPYLQPQQVPQQQQTHAAPAQQNLVGAASRTSVPPRIKRRRGPGGLTRLCGVSPELQAIVGEPAMPRTQIVKQLWAYIRKNNLQDPNNKRKIICNDELRLVLETDCTDIFQMNKLLAKHITPLEPTKNSGQVSKKLKVEDVAEPEPDAGSDPSPTALSDALAEFLGRGEMELPQTEPDAVSGPFPMALSDALAEFLGNGETELLQSEALIRIWDYIKNNQLEDPINSMISCDSKLQQLFGCESLAASGVSEMLACHLFEKS